MRHFDLTAYRESWQCMRELTATRTPASPDEIWFLEHNPVFTLGCGASEQHLLCPGEIEVMRSDRGGEVTYHGPGQLMVYMMMDLLRLQLGVRTFVDLTERWVLRLLASLDVVGEVRPGAPGVYVAGDKIASLGMRVRRGCTYHGLCLNVAPNLEPFNRINPCGYAGLRVTSLHKLGVDSSPQEIALRMQRLWLDAVPRAAVS